MLTLKRVIKVHDCNVWVSRKVTRLFEVMRNLCQPPLGGWQRKFPPPKSAHQLLQYILHHSYHHFKATLKKNLRFTSYRSTKPIMANLQNCTALSNLYNNCKGCTVTILYQEVYGRGGAVVAVRMRVSPKPYIAIVQKLYNC